MKSCEDCKWDKSDYKWIENKMFLRCSQGHARIWGEIIENCHAWGSKEILCCKLINPQAQCQDWEIKVQKGWCKDCVNYTSTVPNKEEECSYCTGNKLFPPPPNWRYCPECGRMIR